MRFVLLVVTMLVLGVGPAAAQGYAQLTYANVVKTLARFGALPLSNDGIIDDFAKLNDCDFYHKHFRDDFALQRRREELRNQIKQKASEYPDSYYFTSKMRLDRYDFKSRIFRLEERSRLVNVNSFSLIKMEHRSVCVEGQRLTTLPDEIGVVLDQPVTIEGLPISDKVAEALIKRMNAEKNYNRNIYARFSVMVVFAAPLDLTGDRISRYNAEAQLLTIEFFEDPEMKKPIWVYTRA